jgi:lipoyl(octanoyl) transferase
MESRAAAIHEGRASELVWLLEHPPLYTRGTSAKESDLLDPARFPVFDARRGGQFTYHGPGQRVAYVMLDLTKPGLGRGRDVKAFVCALEQWTINTLAEFNVKGERRKGRVGVWVNRGKPGGPLREDKIAAIGVRLKHWVSFHGISLNVEPDLTHFTGITPCGVSDPNLGVTSLVDLGHLIPMHEVDVALKRAFQENFGPVERVDPPI